MQNVLLTSAYFRVHFWCKCHPLPSGPTLNFANLFKMVAKEKYETLFLIKDQKAELRTLLFRCLLASLYEFVSVRPSVRSSVG